MMGKRFVELDGREIIEAGQIRSIRYKPRDVFPDLGMATLRVRYDDDVIEYCAATKAEAADILHGAYRELSEWLLDGRAGHLFLTLFREDNGVARLFPTSIEDMLSANSVRYADANELEEAVSMLM